MGIRQVFYSCIRHFLVSIRFQKDRLVMAVHGLFDVGHAGVTDFHGISVEYFV